MKLPIECNDCKKIFQFECKKEDSERNFYEVMKENFTDKLLFLCPNCKT
jgi:hypothetical protein